MPRGNGQQPKGNEDDYFAAMVGGNDPDPDDEGGEPGDGGEDQGEGGGQSNADPYAERFRALEARQEQFFARMEQSMGGYSRGQDRQPPAAPPARQPDPNAPPWQDPLNALIQNQNILVANAKKDHENRARREQREVQRAAGELKQKYPDFDKFVPETVRLAAAKMSIEEGDFDRPWSEDLEGHYWKQKGPQMHREQSQRSRQSDEMSARRERRQGAPSDVPPGGAPYQRPAQRQDDDKISRDKGYRQAQRAFTGELKTRGWR